MADKSQQPNDQAPPRAGFWAKLSRWLIGQTAGKRNAFCSFCCKSYKEVGPLVEGPREAYICGECIRLCDSILEQERRRREGEAAGR